VVIVLVVVHCWERCPDFFEQNPDDEFSQIVENYRMKGLGEGEALDDQTKCILAAAGLCLESKLGRSPKRAVDAGIG
jgi:ferredoxin